jgi:predicted YcjX-like family ATPase
MTIPSPELTSDQETQLKKKVALEYIQEAWDEASATGIESEIIAFAALFAAISDLVTLYGEDAVTEMAGNLPDRVMRGEFSLPRTLQ